MPDNKGGMIFHARRHDFLAEIDPGQDLDYEFAKWCVDHGDYALEFHELQAYVDEGPDVMHIPDPPPALVTSMSGAQFVWYRPWPEKRGHYASLERLSADAQFGGEARDRLIELGLYPPPTKGTNGHIK